MSDMKEKRYVVYWDGGGTNTHHYFKTYEEAKKYLLNNDTGAMRIAFLLAYKKSDIVELGKEELCDSDGEVGELKFSI